MQTFLVRIIWIYFSSEVYENILLSGEHERGAASEHIQPFLCSCRQNQPAKCVQQVQTSLFSVQWRDWSNKFIITMVGHSSGNGPQVCLVQSLDSSTCVLVLPFIFSFDVGGATSLHPRAMCLSFNQIIRCFFCNQDADLLKVGNILVSARL